LVAPEQRRQAPKVSGTEVVDPKLFYEARIIRVPRSLNPGSCGALDETLAPFKGDGSGWGLLLNHSVAWPYAPTGGAARLSMVIESIDRT
jgi:hypothetical protein